MSRAALALGAAVLGVALLATAAMVATADAPDSTTVLRIWWSAVFAVAGAAFLIASVGLWRARKG